jgi:hypothetical membrane protein
MTAIPMTQDAGRTMAPVRSPGRAQRVLLGCGIISLVVYIAADFLGGLRYPGYSFTSQTISELAAIGAPTQSLVGPLFMMYPMLELSFAAGVLRAAAGRSGALRMTGMMLIASSALGIASAWFPMQAPRGLGSLAADAPHIIVMTGIVLLLLLAIGFSAFALGTRFRIYALATVLIVIAFGALTGQYITRVGAGQPTPGLGIIERIEVYATLVWVAVLATALLRRPSHRAQRLLP